MWINSVRPRFYIIRTINFYLANLLLQDTIERIYVEKKYGDIPRGIFLVRGENVSLLGEIVRTKMLVVNAIVYCRTMRKKRNWN